MQVQHPLVGNKFGNMIGNMDEKWLGTGMQHGWELGCNMVGNMGCNMVGNWYPPHTC